MIPMAMAHFDQRIVFYSESPDRPPGSVQKEPEEGSASDLPGTGHA